MCYKLYVLETPNHVFTKCYHHDVKVFQKLKKYVTNENYSNTYKCYNRLVIVLVSSNTSIELKGHMCFVTVDQTVVKSQIRTQIRCVTRRPSNTFIKLE
jgi:hypothetical protein